MKLVSTVKLQKARTRAESAKPYFQKMYDTVQSILSKSGNIEHPYLTFNGSEKKAVIVVTSNRGLAGGYNNNIVKLVADSGLPKESVEIYGIGKKGIESFERRGYYIASDDSDIINEPLFSDAVEIGRKVLDAYAAGEIGEIYLAYTGFKNTVVHTPEFIKLLPVEVKAEEESEKKKTSDTRKYIAQDIADNIASFAQLLEPLNAIKENKIRSKSGILFDWEMRIQALIGDLPIKTYWRNNFRNYEIWSDEKCMEKAGELLSMLELVGIVRDKAKEVVIDKDTLDFYSAQSEHLNNDFHIGETVVVTRPCWKINGHPARKGEIAKKAPFAEFSRKKVSPLETMLRENSCSDGDVNIPVTEDNFCTYDREIPYVKRAIAEGFCKCAVRRMEDGGALAFLSLIHI